MAFHFFRTLFPTYFNFFFLLTPFFVFSVFMSMTENSSQETRKKLSFQIAFGAALVCLLMYFCGTYLMNLFGITVEAFRAGSGVLLLIVAIQLVNSDASAKNHPLKTDEELLKEAIVPLAVPITAGPATLGTMIVKGLEKCSWDERLMVALAIILAASTIGVMLYYSRQLAKVFGASNIAILSKVTGLVLSAIAVSMIVKGVHALWYAAE